MSQLKVDNITDELGTGAPDFPNGATSGGSDVYAKGNIVGTVSQSGGVPTGAIIERGSNANGEFVRYADGTQICFNLNVHILNPIPSGASSIDWTFPAQFIDTNYWVDGNWSVAISTEAGRIDHVTRLRRSASTATSATICWSVNLTVNGLNQLQAKAVGRWY